MGIGIYLDDLREGLTKKLYHYIQINQHHFILYCNFTQNAAANIAKPQVRKAKSINTIARIYCFVKEIFDYTGLFIQRKPS